MNAIDLTKGWYVFYLKILGRSHCVVTKSNNYRRQSADNMKPQVQKVNQNNHFFFKQNWIEGLKGRYRTSCYTVPVKNS